MNAIDSLKTFVGQNCSAESIEARAGLSDMRRTYPRHDELSELGVSERLGPWRIKRDGDIFHWQLAEEPSINERGAWDMLRSSISGEKGERTRVILVGESAAGSFGYWEDATLARQIGDRLSQTAEEFEVIDLTCVNASMDLCLEIMKHAVTLDPDYFILYSANNEGKTLLENFDNGNLNASVPSSVRWSFLEQPHLENYGPDMVNALAEHSVLQLDRARKIAEHFGIELIYVLPESNACDWAPQETTPFAWTGAEVLAGTAKLPSDAVGGAPYPSQLAAWRAARELQLKRPEEALDLFDQARELGVGAFVNAVPQTVGTVARELRKHCLSHQVMFVDMPSLFTSTAEDRWPDRRYFIDYCHLSLEGIALVAEACAGAICKLHCGDDTPAIKRSPPHVSSRERFLGALIGAIHNYHYGQPDEIVAHWLAEAVKADWSLTGEFLSLIRTFLLERARETLTPARFERNSAFAALPDRYKLFFLKFAYHGRFDRRFYRLLDAAIAEDTLGQALQARKDDLLAFQGDIYSLFYLDCHQGIRPRLRGSNRTGWERPDLEFLIESPEFGVDIPPTAFAYDAIEIDVELEGTENATLTCELDGLVLDRQLVKEGRSCHVFSLAQVVHGQRELRSLRFKIDRMVGLADCQGVQSRYRQLCRFGWYPCGGRITKLRLRGSQTQSVPPAKDANL